MIENVLIGTVVYLLIDNFLIKRNYNHLLKNQINNSNKAWRMDSTIHSLLINIMNNERNIDLMRNWAEENIKKLFDLMQDQVKVNEGSRKLFNSMSDVIDADLKLDKELFEIGISKQNKEQNLPGESQDN